LDPKCDLGSGITVDDLLIHDEKRGAESGLSLDRMVYPAFRNVLGLRCVQRPTYDDLLNKQIEDVVAKKGRASSRTFRQRRYW